MNSQEAIILMMAQKLRACDAQEIKKLCAPAPEAGQESSDTVYQTLDRWVKLDKATQQKILSLIKNEDVRNEVHKIKAHINQIMETQKIKATNDIQKDSKA